MKKLSNFITLSIILCFCSCHKEVEFQKIDYNTKIFTLQNMAYNLDPIEKYDYWTLIMSRSDRAEVLFETGDLELRKLINLDYSTNGFYTAGHHRGHIFYIFAIREKIVHEIRDKESLMNFLGEINTKDEALLIATINGFNIDDCFVEGGSFRKIDDKFELLLYKSSFLSLPFRKQYLITVKNNGEWDSIPKEYYCQGIEECYCL